MRKIHKYRLAFEVKLEPQVVNVSLPVMSKLLHVGNDPNGFPCAWFEHEIKFLNQTRRMNFEFLIVGTGQYIPQTDFTHYKSFLEGSLVVHIYIRKGNENNQ